MPYMSTDMIVKAPFPQKPALLVITTPLVPQHKEAVWLNRMFENGLQIAHVRKPDASREQMRTYLTQIDQNHRHRVRLHSHHELVDELGCGGIHYPAAVLPPLPLQPRLSHQGTLLSQSTSFHSLQELQQGEAVGWGALDYAFLSPIFDSLSKQGYQAAGFDPPTLRRLLAGLHQQAGGTIMTSSSSSAQGTGSTSNRSSTSSNDRLTSTCRGPAIIALGGITEETVGQALQLGFQGVAVLGHVWQHMEGSGHHTPVTALKSLQAALQRYNEELTGGTAVH